jgi:CRP-like cAMP-binding protein
MIVIMSNILFTHLLDLAHREQQVAAGDILFRAGDRVRSLFLVIAGALQLTRSLLHGPRLILQRAGPGAVLAEASLFAERYHCEGEALNASVVRLVPVPRLREALGQKPELVTAWTRHLAQEVQRARTHAEIVSLKTVSARIDAWMMLNDGTLPPKGQWRHVADEIGVTPEALYRELARRR